MIYQPTINGGVLPFPSNYRETSTIYLRVPLSIASLLKTSNLLHHLTGLVVTGVGNLCKNALTAVARANSLLSDATEQLIEPEHGIAFLSSCLLPLRLCVFACARLIRALGFRSMCFYERTKKITVSAYEHQILRYLRGIRIGIGFSASRRNIRSVKGRFR